MLAQTVELNAVKGLDAGLVLAFVLLDLTIIFIAARLMGRLARLVGQPGVVGEIVAGVLLGPSLLGRTVFAWDKPWSFLHCDQALAFLKVAGRPPPVGPDLASITGCVFPPQARSALGILGQIALVLFMFLVGLELDFSRLRGRGKGIGAVSIGAIGVPLALGFVVGPLLYNSKFYGNLGAAGAPPVAPSRSAFFLMVGAMLAVTAFPVMARILQEKKLTQSAMGSVGVASAAVVTVLMFLSVAVAAGVATKQGPDKLVVKFVLAGLFIAVEFLLIRPLLVPLGRRYEAKGSLTPGTFAIVMILLFASAYAADRIGINVIVGSFVFGAVLPARAALFREMAGRLSDFTAVILLPIFLAFSGLATDFTKLQKGAVAGIALFLLAGIVGKWLGSAVSARIGGLSWPEGNVLGILMNCRGLLVLVVALIAVSTKVISPLLQLGGVLMALVTTAMTGPLFDTFIRRVPGAAPVHPDAAVPAAAPPDAYRVLVAFSDLSQTLVMAGAAVAVVGDHRPAEIVLCRLIPLPVHDEVASGINDEAVEVDRSLAALSGLALRPPEGVAVTPVATMSADFSDDLVRIATDRDCDVVLVGWDRPALPAGDVERELRDVLAETATDVVVYCDGRAAAGGGPVVVADLPGEGDAASFSIAENVAHALGQSVERTEAGFGDSARLIEASRRSSALVLATGVGDPGRGRLFGALDDSVVAGAACPVFIVRAAGRVEPARALGSEAER